MDLSEWVKVYDRLLPRSRAWDLTPEKTLKQFFEGLAIAPKNAKDHLASVFLEMLPFHTTYLKDWSEQFGSLITFDADELAAEWAAIGGQDPDYIQTCIQSICPNCYVHEWWVPGSDPVEARNPFVGTDPYHPENLIESSFVLVNDLTDMFPNYTYQFGDGTEFVGDNSVQFGEYDGHIWRLKRYPCPNVPNEYPTYWYVGGETWPEFAHIAPSKLRPLMRMIFKIKPVHTRCILMVIPDGDEDYDIQNVVTETEPELNTVTSPTDEEIQNYS
jgi:hypothetical protein